MIVLRGRSVALLSLNFSKLRKYLYIFLVFAFAALAAGYLLLKLRHSGEQITTVSYPVVGIDISSHNGPDIDFEALRSEGIEFVILKATEGVSLKDSRFHTNYLKATRAGLKVGVYHFFRFDCTGMMQAINLIHSVRGKSLDLPLIIDAEEWSNPITHPTPGVVESLYDMINYLDSHGYPVMIYTNKNGYERFVRGRLEEFPLWLCSLSELGDGSPSCRIWQFSHRGDVKGVNGPVDLNAFVGSREEWDQWLNSFNRTASDGNN